MKESIIDKADRVLANTYKRPPVVFQDGSGCTVRDTQGRTYLDFVSGIAVCNLGHAHPRVAKALSRQAETLLHLSNLYYTVPQVELAAYLTEKSFADRVFFCNSGAEANEAAIKLSRRYFKESGEKDRFRIVAMEKSFHGRTMGTLSATGQEKVRQGYDPILEGFDFVPFNDFEALRKRVTPATCAVLLEPIQGEGGVCSPDAGYLPAVRKLCDDTGTLLVFDEIQTGIGRTGTLFAYESLGVEPDVMTLAKALANGLPIGAMLAREKFAAAFTPGAHASTFGGTPVVTAVALEVLKIIVEEGVLAHGAEAGAYFKEKLLQLKGRHPVVEDVRGRGLLIGMKIRTEGEPIVRKCLENGFLINCVQGNILRFIPPLIIERAEIDSLVSCLDRLLGESETVSGRNLQ